MPSGLEGMFEEQATYLAGLGGADPDPAVLRGLAERYGVRTLGPPLSPEER